MDQDASVHLARTHIFSDVDPVTNPPGFVFVPPVYGTTLHDQSQTPLVQFQSDGNTLLFKGELSEEQMGLTEDTQVPEFVVRDSAGNIIMQIDDATGNLAIRGILTQDVTPLLRSPGDAFLIVNKNDAPTGSPPEIPPAIVLRSNGDLMLKGKKFLSEE